MRLYGYRKGAEEDTPAALQEVTVQASPATLRRLAEFLLHVADRMERHGAAFGHEHFEDWDTTTRSEPSVVVAADRLERPHSPSADRSGLDAAGSGTDLLRDVADSPFEPKERGYRTRPHRDHRLVQSQSKVCLDLTPDEALVLFDWLHRFNEAESQQFEDQAEQRVLWNLEAMLESALAEILDPRYEELLAAARRRVRDPEE